VGDSYFKVIFAAKNSNKFQKNSGFGRKNQLRTLEHLKANHSIQA
jgi:hypothetical protein